MQLSDGLCCGFLGGIKKGQITDQYHFLFILNGKIVLLAKKALMSQGQHTHALVVHLLDKLLCFHPYIFGKWTNLTPKFSIGTDSKHLLHGPFGDNLSFAIVVLHHD